MYIGYIFEKKSNSWSDHDQRVLKMRFLDELADSALSESGVTALPTRAFFSGKDSIYINDKEHYEAALAIVNQYNAQDSDFGLWVKARGQELGFAGANSSEFNIDHLRDIEEIVRKSVEECRDSEQFQRDLATTITNGLYRKYVDNVDSRKLITAIDETVDRIFESKSASFDNSKETGDFLILAHAINQTAMSLGI